MSLVQNFKVVGLLYLVLTIDYNRIMVKILQTETFEKWLEGLRDPATRRRLVLRIRKASLGQLGDVKPVGHGVFEMREFFGPGWRMYYLHRGELVIMMLGGGDKSSQASDIEAAKAKAKELTP